MISQSLTEYEHTVLMLVWSPGGCPDDEGSIRFICSARSGAAVQNIEADAFLAKVNIIQYIFLSSTQHSYSFSSLSLIFIVRAL